MLNPDQVKRLKLALESSPDLKEFEGYNLTAKVVPIGIDKTNINIEPKKRFNPPNYVYNEPIDPTCLKGTERSEISAKNSILQILPDAHIIGFTSVISEGLLYCPNQIDPSEARQLLRENVEGYHGYSVYAKGAELVIHYVSRETPRVNKCTALFFHNIESGNYGSFLFRQLPQLIATLNKNISFDIYIVPDRKTWLIEALELLGLPRRPVYNVNEVSGDRFDKIICSTNVDAEGFLDNITLNGLELLKNRVKSTCFNESTRKIYVSRNLSSLSRPKYRPLVNEVDIEEFLKNIGFEIIYPEVLSFKEQIALFSSSYIIIGPSGSGMLNCIFAPDSAFVLDLESYHVCVRQHAKMYSSSNKNYYFLFGKHCGEERHAITRDWYVDMELLKYAVDNIIKSAS